MSTFTKSKNKRLQDPGGDCAHDWKPTEGGNELVQQYKCATCQRDGFRNFQDKLQKRVYVYHDGMQYGHRNARWSGES